MRITFVCILILVLCSSCVAGDSCVLKQSRENGFINSPITFSAENLRTDRTESKFHVLIKNVGQHPIDRVVAVFELFRQRAFIYSLPVEATVATGYSENGNLPHSRDVPLFYGLDHSVLPGASASVDVLVPSVPTVCPDKIRLTFAHVDFAGSAESYERATAGWRLDPQLDLAKPWAVDDLQGRAPYVALLRLRIDQNGKAAVTLSSDAEDRDSERWLTKQIEENWSFSPARYDSKAITWEKWLVVALFSRTPAFDKEMKANLSALHVPSYSFVELEKSVDRLHVRYGSEELAVKYSNEKDGQR